MAKPSCVKCKTSDPSLFVEEFKNKNQITYYCRKCEIRTTKPNEEWDLPSMGLGFLGGVAKFTIGALVAGEVSQFMHGHSHTGDTSGTSQGDDGPFFF